MNSNPSVVQPAARQYTDCATEALLIMDMWRYFNMELN
jgi:hypothetical protein